MKTDLLVQAMTASPPYNISPPRGLTPGMSVVDGAGRLTSAFIGALSNRSGSFVIRLEETEMDFLRNGQYAEFRKSFRERVERYGRWQSEAHQQAALTHVEMLSDSGLGDLVLHPWNPKPSFAVDLQEKAHTPSFGLAATSLVSMHRVRASPVPSFFMLDATGHAPFNRMLEGLACLPERALDFIPENPAWRTVFANFMALARVNGAASEMLGGREGQATPGFFADCESVGYVNAAEALHTAGTDRAGLRAIRCAVALRGIATGSWGVVAAAPYSDANNYQGTQNDFDNFRVDLIAGAAGVATVSDASRQALIVYLSHNDAVYAARSRNLFSVLGFDQDAREGNDLRAGNISAFLPGMLDDSALEPFRHVIGLGPRGHIEAFTDPDKLLAGLRKLNFRKYEKLNLRPVRDISKGLFRGRPASPSAPNWRALRWLRNLRIPGR